MAVYLDHNASTPLDARVLEAMLPYLRDCYGNASSAHVQGRAARAAVERAREQLAALINADPADIIFTGGGTEANNLALHGVLNKFTPSRLAISGIEHASVRGPAAALAQRGWQVDNVGVDEQGRVTPDALRAALHPGTRLVSVMLANNETGVLQDMRALGALTRRAGVPLHSDAAQALGKIPVDFRANGAQLMSLSAHKLGGPKGVGALVADKSVPLEPLLHGGGHERGRRAGTENVAAIVGFGAAAEYARAELDARRAHWLALRDHLEQRLRVLPGVVIFGGEAERLPNTVLVSVPRFAGATLVEHLDRAGVMVSSGSACAAGNLAPSHVLQAMNVAPELLRNVVRVSFGLSTTRADVDSFLAALQQLIDRFVPWRADSALPV